MTSLRVLIVDDDFLVARVHTGFVEAVEGFDVIGTAATGEQAIAAVHADPPDVLLLDVHLPDLSGLEVLRRLRAQGYRGEVLMVTAERDLDAVRAARAAGARGYLAKPFTRDDLRTRLVEVRTAHEQLAALPETAADQQDIDQLFAAGPRADAAPLPKGLNAETARLVLDALGTGELSATGCATAVGLSRVTARRYLEHFVRTGAAVARQQYGRPGRPERLYRLTGTS